MHKFMYAYNKINAKRGHESEKEQEKVMTGFKGRKGKVEMM